MDVRIKIDPETGVFKAIMLWHPINGVWTHIAQQFEGEEIQYYTDGTLISDVPEHSQVMLGLINKANSVTTEETTNADGS